MSMDMINIETGNLGPLYQCCATNPAPDAPTQDIRVKLDAQQRRLIPVTAITPVTMPSVIQILEAKRRDLLKQKEQMRNNSSNGGGGYYAPTSTINPNFHDPRLRRGPANTTTEIHAGVGAAGTITAATDELAVNQLMEKTKAYALTLIDGCASAEEYNRLLSTRIRKNANSNEAITAQLLSQQGGGNSSQLLLSQLGGAAAASSVVGGVLPGSFAQIQMRFGPDVNLLSLDEARLDMFSSMGMLSPQEKQTILNQQRISKAESGGGIDVGTDLSIFHHSSSSAGSMRTMLKPFEAYMLATLMPATVEEALAYVPTLAAYEPLTIEAVLKNLRMGGGV